MIRDALARRFDDPIEAEICELAAHLDAANHRFLTLIREYDRSGKWVGWGIRSCAHWLAWKCGLTPGAARERVRVARALGELPLIDAALAKAEISYSKVRALVRVATPENEERLARTAKTATAAQLERICRGLGQVRRAGKPSAEPERWVVTRPGDGDMVRIEAQLHPDEAAIVLRAIDELRAMKKDDSAESLRNASAQERERAPEGAHVAPPMPSRADGLVKLAELALAPPRDPILREPARTGGDRATLLIHVERSDLTTGHGATLEDGTRICAETLRRLACDSGLVAVLDGDVAGKTLDVGRKTRSIPPAIRRALQRRDRTCCFPGCTHTRWLDGHHAEHWLHGGATKLANLLLLCPFHHRLVHEGGFTLEIDPNGHRTFRDPEGRVLAPPRSPQLDPLIALARLRADNENAGAHIDERTSASGWRGERVDYSWVVDWLAAG
jgi:hypothetical protein